MIHEIKVTEDVFKELVIGNRAFMVLKNDKMYKQDDYLAINEAYADEVYEDSIELVPTGKSVMFNIGYVMDDKNLVRDGFIIVGIEPCSVHKSARITDLSILFNER